MMSPTMLSVAEDVLLANPSSVFIMLAVNSGIVHSISTSTAIRSGESQLRALYSLTEPKSFLIFSNIFVPYI